MAKKPVIFQSSRSLRTATNKEREAHAAESISILAVLADRDIYGDGSTIWTNISILAVLADRDQKRGEKTMEFTEISILAVLADRDEIYAVSDNLQEISILAVLADRDLS